MIANKYWHVEKGQGWQFQSQQAKLWKHGQAHVQRHIKVKGAASPYNGDLLYWSQQLKTHPLCNGVKGVLLRKQQGNVAGVSYSFKTPMLLKSTILPQREKAAAKNSVTNACSTDIAMMNDTHGV